MLSLRILNIYKNMLSEQLNLSNICVIVLLCLSACHPKEGQQKIHSSADRLITSSSKKTSSSEKQEPENFELSEYEDYQLVDVAAFNQRLRTLEYQYSAEDILDLYYPATVFSADSYEKIERQKTWRGDTLLLNLLHDNQPHIKIQGHRIQLSLIRKSKQWRVLNIKQQFKCWERTAKQPLWSAYNCN